MLSFEGLDAGDNVIVTPLTFLGGAFYPINMPPHVWQNVALLNPMAYLISGFRWRFYGVGDINEGINVAATLGFLALCLGTIWWIFRTGCKLKV